MAVGLVVAVAGVAATIVFGVLQNRKKEPKKLSATQDALHKDVLSNIKKNKLIKVGWFPYPPFVYPTDTDIPTGLYPKLLNSIAKSNELEIIWKQLNLSESIQSVQNGTIDFFLCIFQTPARSKQVDFTAFLHSVAIAGISNPAFNHIASQADLRNSHARIVVGLGEIGYEIAVLDLKIPKTRLLVVETDDPIRIISMVETGEADIALVDAISCSNYLKRKTDSNLKLIFDKNPISICSNGVMIPRNQKKLSKWINKQFHEHRMHPEIIEEENIILKEYENIINQL